MSRTPWEEREYPPRPVFVRADTAPGDVLRAIQSGELKGWDVIEPAPPPTAAQIFGWLQQLEKQHEYLEKTIRAQRSDVVDLHAKLDELLGRVVVLQNMLHNRDPE